MQRRRQTGQPSILHNVQQLDTGQGQETRQEFHLVEDLGQAESRLASLMLTMRGWRQSFCRRIGSKTTSCPSMTQKTEGGTCIGHLIGIEAFPIGSFLLRRMEQDPIQIDPFQLSNELMERRVGRVELVQRLFDVLQCLFNERTMWKMKNDNGTRTKSIDEIDRLSVVAHPNDSTSIVEMFQGRFVTNLSDLSVEGDRRNVFPMVTPVRTSETGVTDQLIDQKRNRMKGLLRWERRTGGKLCWSSC